MLIVKQHKGYFHSSTRRYPFTDGTTLVDRGHKTERLTKWTKKFSFVGPRFFSPVTKSMISCWNLIIRFGYFWHSCTKRWDNNLENSKLWNIFHFFSSAILAIFARAVNKGGVCTALGKHSAVAWKGSRGNSLDSMLVSVQPREHKSAQSIQVFRTLITAINVLVNLSLIVLHRIQQPHSL